MMDNLELYSVWWFFKLDTEILWDLSEETLESFLSNLSPLERRRFDSGFLDFQRKAMKSSGAKLISIRDENYPKLLKEIPKPPPFLFCLGDDSILREPMLSIVGTRRSTRYGMKMAERFAEEISKLFVVVSGMAYGIDSSAHEGALRGGTTVAVLASGVDVPTPKGNENLYRRIIERGCVLSAYPLGEEAKKHRFPERNSIIAGLSVGTLVIEAPVKSGALITARYAAEFGRDVFAVPGDVGRVQSEGTNLLIKSGAILVTSPGDILEYYGFQSNSEDVDNEILKLVKEGFDTIDALIDKTGLDIEEVLAKISELEIEGLLLNDGGKLRVL